MALSPQEEEQAALSQDVVTPIGASDATRRILQDT